MSFTNGIGRLQQPIDPTAPSETKPAKQVSVAENEARQGVVSGANVDHADQANLSSAGGLVAQALESSDTRSAKIASLQQAIGSGSYSVSSADVADKIIQSLLD